MIIGRVISTIISSRKYDSLQGLKLLVIEPCYKEQKDYFVAADAIGAGIGELVLITEGDNTKYAIVDKQAPIDAVVVGIVDKDPEF